MTEPREPTDLERALSGVPHPAAPVTDDELVEFALGELDELRAEAVRERLANDPAAVRRVLDLKASLAGEPPPGEAPISASEVKRAWERLDQELGEAGSHEPSFRPLTAMAPLPGGFRLASPSLAWSIAAMSLLLTVASALWLVERFGHSRRLELAVQRAEGQRDQAVSELERLAAMAKTPQPNTTFVHLSAAHDFVRGEEVPATRRQLRFEGTLVYLSLAIPELPGDVELTAVFHLAGREVPVMNVPGLRAREGAVSMTVSQQILAPGVYAIKLYGPSEGRRRELADYELEVVAGDTTP